MQMIGCHGLSHLHIMRYQAGCCLCAESRVTLYTWGNLHIALRDILSFYNLGLALYWTFPNLQALVKADLQSKIQPSPSNLTVFSWLLI